MDVRNDVVVFSFLYFRNDTNGVNRFTLQHMKQNYSKDTTIEERLAQYQKYIFKNGLFGRQFPVEGTAVKKRVHANQLVAILPRFPKLSMMVNFGILD